MPNIEVYAGNQQYNKLPQELRSKIVKIIKEMGIEEEVMTTVINCYPELCDGKHTDMPFIRICGTDTAEMEKIIKAFKCANLNIDTETLLLNKFIPANEMKN